MTCGRLGIRNTATSWETEMFLGGTNGSNNEEKYFTWTGSKTQQMIYKYSLRSDYIPFKIVKTGNNIKGYIDDTLVADISYDWIGNVASWDFVTTQWIGAGVMKVKNIKIKPYSEV